MSRREGSLENPQADSSISPLPHLEAKIRQTHSLARLLTKYAEQLLQEYVSGNGFGGAQGLRNGEVQITEVPDTQFSDLISQIQTLEQTGGLPLCSICPSVCFSLEVPPTVHYNRG
uniref:Cardiotrophin 1 n=1 Tax=Ursus americanus TaxID=9643 RepID=A0A452SGP8_URSAM